MLSYLTCKEETVSVWEATEASPCCGIPSILSAASVSSSPLGGLDAEDTASRGVTD